MARILYFTRDYTTHDHRFLSALAQTEHQVIYLRLERRGGALEDRPLPPEIEQVAWAGGQEPFERRMIPALRADLNRVIAAVRPDLVHAGPIQSCALLAALAGFQPLVSMSWGSDLLVEAGSSAWSRWATRYVLRRTASLVGDCEPVRQAAVAFGMPAGRIVTFPWGIDLARFSPGPEPYRPSPQTFHLLSTRSWEPIYGVDVIARAFVQAAREHPGLRLTMLGHGSQAALLRRIFAQGGVEDRVFFPGQVSQARLPDLYRSADLYVAASHSDGTSISLLEALACGRPALVSDIPGNREWIVPGEQGWLFPDGDAGALAQAILHAASRSGALQEMGRRARLLAEDRADWNQNFKELLRAYEVGLKVEG